MGFVCSLFLLMFASTGALAGKVALELGSSEPLRVEISRATSPVLFGSVILIALVLAAIAVAVTGRGLRKALRAENE